MNLWVVATIVLLLNLPFGYWRANVRKLSIQWFLAIHLPVPVVVALRIFSGLGWELITFPVLVGAFFFGQFAAGQLRLWWRKHTTAPLTSCLVVDLTRQITGMLS